MIKGIRKAPIPSTKLLRQPPELFLAGCSSAEPASAYSGIVKLNY